MLLLKEEIITVLVRPLTGSCQLLTATVHVIDGWGCCLLVQLIVARVLLVQTGSLVSLVSLVSDRITGVTGQGVAGSDLITC